MMNKKLLSLIIVIIAIAMPAKLWAQEAYAVLSEDSLTVTFYYDGQKTVRGGMDINNAYIAEGVRSPYGTAVTAVFDTSFANYRPTSTVYWFYECENLEFIEGLQNLKTDNVTEMYLMFAGCTSLTSLDLSGFNTQNVTKMNSMFQHCSGLTSLDLSGFNTQNVTNMGSMFLGCSGLTSLDVSGFDTKNVRQMYSMFLGCSGLTSLDVTGFNTQNVADMSAMFSYCSGLTSLDVTGFNTQNVTEMYGMFDGCSSLTSLDVTGFNTQNVTSMQFMFEGCSGLTSLDVSGFDTKNVQKMWSMFQGCSGLKIIYAGNDWSTSSVTDGKNMFTGCSSLVGGKGTKYDENHVDHTYAHIDEGPSNPGYFTRSGDAPYVAPEYSFDSSTGVLTVRNEMSLTEALKSASEDGPIANRITAIIWENNTALTNDDLQGLDNPNMLIYVDADSLAPQNRNNVVVDGRAKNIVLTDVTEGNGSFYCPQEFMAEMISYTRNFQQKTEIGVSRGWETIALPFDVQTIMHEKNGLIAPFGNSTSNKHFWLRQLTQQGLEQATIIQANWPYLISMPNSESYPAGYNLNGRVTFSAQDVVVPETEEYGMEMYVEGSGMVMMRPTFSGVSKSASVYALNVGEARGNNPEGSVFEVNYRDIRPFEAYTIHEGNGPAPQFIPVAGFTDGSTTGIEDVRGLMSDGRGENWYDLNGRKLQGRPSQKGVYIQNGNKVVIK